MNIGRPVPECPACQTGGVACLNHNGEDERPVDFEVVGEVDPNRDLVIGDEDDFIASVKSDDLLSALNFFVVTVRGFGPEDIASFLSNLFNREVTDAEVNAMADRLAGALTEVEAVLSE